MSYPKPLSEKSLNRLYSEAGLNEIQISFLHDFFAACANLYGVITAEDAWDVYRELSSKAETPRLHRKDMYAALGILRRESVPYYVFEADEVYTEEPRADKLRIVALREIVPQKYARFWDLYHILEASDGKPFYVPENLLTFVTMPESRYEQELLGLLGNLKATLSEYEDNQGRMHPCKYQGKFLKGFAFVSADDDFELRILRGEVDGFKGNSKKAEEYEKQINSVTADRYLVNGLKWRNSIGHFPPSKSIEYFFDSLTEMGVVLPSKQSEKLLALITDMNNNQHLWCNHGWTPSDLSAQFSGSVRPMLSFGPGIQQAFANGSMDRTELERKMKELGIEVLK
ncbi:MAG: hypothetical protein E7474_05270 [Ruminococcaceae bacterium]|nr:hypothetical protein [Oscillospiraceae bacterium]